MISPITNCPVWYDLSSWNGEIKFAKIFEGQVIPHGIYSRAGVGINKDVQFLRNYEKTGEYDLYRTSYWAIWPELDCNLQLARWYEQHPVLDGIPRIIDLEHQGGMDVIRIADIVSDWADEIYKRDGVLPWIYTRASIVDEWLANWHTEEVNEFYYILAEYNNFRNKEEDGIKLPNRVDASRVLFKQTADQIPPDPLGLAPESAYLDRNRWLPGDVINMNQFLITTYFGTDIPDIPGDCDELEQLILSKTYNNQQAIQKNVDDIEGLTITVVDNHNNIAANDADIDTAFVMINENYDDIVKLKAADLLLDVKVKGLTEGQLEIVEDVIAVEDNLKDIANNQSEIYSEIERIDSDINGLEGGHTHPKIMYWLGLAK